MFHCHQTQSANFFFYCKTIIQSQCASLDSDTSKTLWHLLNWILRSFSRLSLSQDRITDFMKYMPKNHRCSLFRRLKLGELKRLLGEGCLIIDTFDGDACCLRCKGNNFILCFPLINEIFYAEFKRVIYEIGYVSCFVFGT